MRNSYDVKLSTLQENLRKEKETGALYPGAAWEPTSCVPYTWAKGPLHGRLRSLVYIILPGR